MNIILWVIFGGLAGWIATMIVGNDASYGVAGNVIVGILGAFLGGWIADKLGASGQPGTERPSSSVVSFIIAVVGAVILLVLLNLIF
ncbi:MAG: GlsB/YeaQ/YmgE family stress response membrane protein [bacterium]|nr:GlsB/YeaQ/YmgE family stress response membrane protein [bacterium]